MPWIIMTLLLLTLGALFLLLAKHRRLQAKLDAPEDNTSMLLLQQQVQSLQEQVRANLESSAQLVQQQLSNLTSQVNERLKDSNQLLHQSQQALGNRLDRAAQVVSDLQGKLGKLEENNRQIFEVGKDIRSLQDLLRAPKLRGSLGEYFLADLLRQILPPEHFQLQHAFRNNEKVDAVIQLSDRLVPIDAKFPLENFQRIQAAVNDAEKKSLKKAFMQDVKKHIEAIAQKYIRPDEGTYDFALMYVPAENVYYEIIVKDELTEGEHLFSQWAMGKRVIAVSPNTLYLYLTTILLGLKGLKIEKMAHEILNSLSRLGSDLQKVRDSFRKVGTHLSHAQGAFDETQTKLGRFEDKLEGLQGNSTQEVQKLPETLEENVPLLS